MCKKLKKTWWLALVLRGGYNPNVLASGVGGGGAGVQTHPQKFWFGENPGKFSENPGKISGNLGKICKNLHKFHTPWKCKQTWCPTCFDMKKMAPSVLWFEKMAPKMKWHEEVFFGGHLKYGLHAMHKSGPKIFEQIWGNSGKNHLHPQKFACSYNYGVSEVMCSIYGAYSLRWVLFLSVKFQVSYGSNHPKRIFRNQQDFFDRYL